MDTSNFKSSRIYTSEPQRCDHFIKDCLQIISDERLSLSHLVYSDKDSSLLGFITLAAGKFKGKNKDSDQKEYDTIPILEIDQFAIDEKVENKEEIFIKIDRHVKGIATTIASKMIGCKFLFIWVENHKEILDIFINKLHFTLVEDFMITSKKHRERIIKKHAIEKKLVSLLLPIINP